MTRAPPSSLPPCRDALNTGSQCGTGWPCSTFWTAPRRREGPGCQLRGVVARTAHRWGRTFGSGLGPGRPPAGPAVGTAHERVGGREALADSTATGDHHRRPPCERAVPPPLFAVLDLVRSGVMGFEAARPHRLRRLIASGDRLDSSLRQVLRPGRTMLTPATQESSRAGRLLFDLRRCGRRNARANTT